MYTVELISAKNSRCTWQLEFSILEEAIKFCVNERHNPKSMYEKALVFIYLATKEIVNSKAKPKHLFMLGTPIVMN